jgi:hypothetical protein
MSVQIASNRFGGGSTPGFALHRSGQPTLQFSALCLNRQIKKLVSPAKGNLSCAQSLGDFWNRSPKNAV